MLLDLDFWKFAGWCLLAVFGLVVIPLALGWAFLTQGIKMLLPWVRSAFRYVTGPDEE